MKEVTCWKIGENFRRIVMRHKNPYGVKISFLSQTIESILDGSRKSISFIIPHETKSTIINIISVDSVKRTFVMEYKNEKYLVNVVNNENSY